ncbi:hypothetical protein [Consotaella salsifontis]|nr:hypothetical protein [Consotaella salsifontis]
MTAPNGAVDGTTIGTVPPAAGPITNRAVTGTVDPAIAGQTGLTTRGSGFTDGRNAAAGETYIRETGSVTGMPRPRVGVDLDKIRNAMEADTGSSPPPSAW